MTLELSAQEEAGLQALVDAGHYATMEDAARGSLHKAIADHKAWLTYVHEAIAEGLDDIANGRLIDGETFMRELRATKQEAA